MVEYVCPDCGKISIASDEEEEQVSLLELGGNYKFTCKECGTKFRIELVIWTEAEDGEESIW